MWPRGIVVLPGSLNAAGFLLEGLGSFQQRALGSLCLTTWQNHVYRSCLPVLQITEGVQYPTRILHALRDFHIYVRHSSDTSQSYLHYSFESWAAGPLVPDDKPYRKSTT